MQTALANNRKIRRRVHIRPNLTIMKGTIADLKFIRYGDMIFPVIMGKERKRIINSIVPQGLNQYVNNLLTVNSNAQSGNQTISGWSSSSNNAIQLVNNGSVVQTLGATVIPVLNGSTVIWVFIANDLSSASYNANQVNLLASVNYVTTASGGAIQYSPPFNLATATTSIVKQSGETISFVWEIQLNLGLYSIPTVPTSCSGSSGTANVTLGTFGGVDNYTHVTADQFGNPVYHYAEPYHFSSITLQYIGGSSSANISSITSSYDGINTYLIITASISVSSQVTATSVVVNVSYVGGSELGFCINGQLVTSGSVIQIPYSATVPSGTVTVTVTIEFSPAT
jgi:hypothetical protein